MRLGDSLTQVRLKDFDAEADNDAVDILGSIDTTIQQDFTLPLPLECTPAVSTLRIRRGTLRSWSSQPCWGSCSE